MPILKLMHTCYAFEALASFQAETWNLSGHQSKSTYSYVKLSIFGQFANLWKSKSACTAWQACQNLMAEYKIHRSVQFSDKL